MFRTASVLAVLLAATGGLAASRVDAQTCGPGNYFKPQATFAAGAYAVWTAIADFDGDGNPDIAVADYNDNNVRILPGRGDGTFATGVAVAVGSGPRSIAAGDFDGDGRPDLAVATLLNNSAVVLRNQGGFSFTSVGPFSLGSPPRGIAMADFDRDGILDIAAGTDAGLSVLRGQGTGGVWNGSFDPVQRVNTTTVWGIRVADMDGDGWVDVVGAAAISTALQIFYNTGSGFLAGSVALNSVQGDVAVADFNGDGRMDIAAAAGQITILLNQGGRVFSVNNYLQPGVFNGITAADFTHDGLPDVAARSRRSRATPSGWARWASAPPI
jgi:VCBS repeat protein